MYGFSLTRWAWLSHSLGGGVVVVVVGGDSSVGDVGEVVAVLLVSGGLLISVLLGSSQVGSAGEPSVLAFRSLKVE